MFLNIVRFDNIHINYQNLINIPITNFLHGKN